MVRRVRDRFVGVCVSIVSAVVACVTCVSVAMADMQGIDVSGWQSAYVTQTVDYDFAIIKATQGVGDSNGNFDAQVSNVVNRGKGLGLYHFANGGDVSAEAEAFLRRARPYLGRAVLALDWESCLAYGTRGCIRANPQWGNGDWIRRFVNYVHDRTNVWPLVYIQASAVRQVPADVRANCGLWVAQYASNNPTGYQAAPWRIGLYGEAVRQYASTGRLNGYAGNLDLNVFRGNRDQWDRYANPGAVSRPSGGAVVSPSVDWDALAVAVIRGDYGNGGVRVANVNRAYGAGAYERVQSLVNRRLGGGAVSVASGARTHVVGRGECLWSIFGTDWARVARINGLVNPSLIYPGQVLRY